VGRTIEKVVAPDAWFLKHGTTARALRAACTGRTVVGTRRIGKLMLLDTDGPVLGLRFGMTGRLFLDGKAPIERLEYSSARFDPAWIRFSLRFEGGGHLDLVDARRLGGVELEPDVSRLGPDALEISLGPFRAALAVSRAPIKAWLLDQQRIAGVGNLIADETLWRAGIDPARAGRSLEPPEVAVLHRTLRRTIAELTKRGGSHTGDLQVARVRGAACPRDGAILLRRTVGGRTTYSCPLHQR
jgi:formamidopyrimidine-DNA glycosylase